jgi:hypothetical protein
LWRTIFAFVFLFLVYPVSNILVKIIKDSKQNNIQLAVQNIINVEDLTPVVAQMAIKQDMLLLFWNAIKYNLNARDFSPV